MSTDKEPIPRQFIDWAEIESLKEFSKWEFSDEARDKKLWLRAANHMAIAVYRHLSSQPSPGLPWIKADVLPKMFVNVIAATNKGHYIKTCVDASGGFDTFELEAYEGEFITHYLYLSAPVEEQKPIHPVYKGWDSLKLIGRVRERFKELIHKGWDWRSYYNGWLEGRAGMLQEMQKELDGPEAPAPPISARPACTCEHGPTGDNPTCSYPNCYPEGGGEGEEKIALPIIGIDFSNKPSISGYSLYANGEFTQITKEQFDSLSATPEKSEVQPIADGKEVPQEIETWISMWLYDNVVSGPGDFEIHNAKVVWARAIALAMYHHIGRDTSVFDGMYKVKEQQLLAARNEISTQGEQIAKLLAENKEYKADYEKCVTNLLDAYKVVSGLLPANSRWQEKYIKQRDNLTAMIEVDLQKSKRLDEVEKEAGQYRAELQHVITYLEHDGYTLFPRWIKKLLAKHLSPAQNPDK